MKKVSILLVDDHAVVRSGIANALKELPELEIVGEASNGPELFVALVQTQPDFLIIDVNMPDFEPITAIHRIRINYPEMKILVVSAYDDDVYVQGLLKTGVDGYHLKDQSLAELQLAVKRILSGKKWVSSPLLDKLVSYENSPSHLLNIPALTPRQREILQLLQQGYDNHTIAQQIGLSIKTIEKYLTRLYRQLNVQSRLEAASYVTQHPEILGVTGQVVAQYAPPVQTPTGEQLTILLVDDNARYRHQLQRMVGKVSPQTIIYEAENIAEAVHLAKRIAPRLVFVDVVLGDENGIQCVRRIKGVSPASRVILISAYPDREFHRLGLEAEAIAFLDKKDLTAMALQQVINDAIP